MPTSSPDRQVICVSGAEPKWLKDGLAKHFELVLGNKLTEARGVDIAWHGGQARNGNDQHWWGVQRKAVSDLLASVQDGRLQREVAQMNASTGVHLPFMIVEGKVAFTNDGRMIRDRGQEYTRRQWRGLLWSIAAAGITVLHTDGPLSTVDMLLDLHAWSMKDKHLTLKQRPGAPSDDWGQRGSADWARHMLQGFDGIGPETAEAIIKEYGLPLQWTVSEQDLLAVAGIGKVRAEKLVRALQRVDL